MTYTDEEIGRLKQERHFLEHRGTSWHSQKGGLLYLSFAFGALTVAEIFFGSAGLGRTGAALTAMLSIAGFVYYRWREEQDQNEWRRRNEIDEILKHR